MLLVIIVLIFVCAMLFVMGLAAPSPNHNALRQRMADIARGMPDPAAPPSLSDAHFDVSFGERVLGPALGKLGLVAARYTPAGASSNMRRNLDKAGNPPRLGVAEFAGIRIVSAIAGCGLGLMTAPLIGNTPVIKLCVLGLGALIGAVLPDAMLQRTITERQMKIRKSLADTLDLLIVSVEAGLGLDGAMAKVVEKKEGPLSDEFKRSLQEMRLGKTRSESLKAMSLRMDVPEVTTFVAAIYQADQLGVSISRVLRIQSDTVRVARAQRVREAAAKLPVKMLFPLVLFIFPAILVVLVGPGFMSILKALGSM